MPNSSDAEILGPNTSTTAPTPPVPLQQQAQQQPPPPLPSSRSASPGELHIASRADDAALIVELMPDGRLRAAVERTRQVLRERMTKAEVLRTGPGWLVMRTLDTAPPASPRERAESDREVVVAGTLGAGGLPIIDFLGFLASGQQTGVLAVLSGDTERSIFLSRGDVVWATSSSGDDRLGEFLLRRGKITREQLQLAVRDGERRLGQACVERGFIAAHELWINVQAQLTEIVDKLLGTEHGLWSFSRISETALAESQIHMSTQALLMDALRRLDEMSLYRQRIRGVDTIVERPLALRSTGAAEELVAALAEDTREGAAQLLLQLPGSATVQELMRILGKSEFDVTRLVYHLVQARLVDIVDAHDTGPIPRRVTTINKTEAREVIGVFSMALREMFDEMGRINQIAALLLAADEYLRDEASAQAGLLKSVKLSAEGILDEEALLLTIHAAHATAQDLSDALSELLFFVLFQATEFLGPKRGDDLARRVKLILGMLSNTRAQSRPEEGP